MNPSLKFYDNIFGNPLQKSVLITYNCKSNGKAKIKIIFIFEEHKMEEFQIIKECSAKTDSKVKN